MEGGCAVAFTIYDMMERQLVKRNIASQAGARVVSRAAFVSTTAFIGITAPFFDALLVRGLLRLSSAGFNLCERG